MEFRILGPVEVRDGDRLLPVDAPKQRALLVALLLDANHVLSTEQLIDRLWGQQPPRSARVTLQNYVHRLRAALRPAGGDGRQDRLVTLRPGYLLRVGPGELDLHRFQQLVEDGRAAAAAGRFAVAADRLRTALGLWRGPALAGVALGPAQEADAAHLEQLRMHALEQRIEADLALGRHHDLVDELRALIAEQPLREHTHAQLMLALYRCGRRAEALDAYQQARRSLVEELGLEPGDQLQDLQRAILSADPSLRPGGGGQAGRSDAVAAPRQLPPDIGDFTGRWPLTGQLEQLLAGPAWPATAVRVVCLAGPAGIGKTTLAMHVAHRLRSRFPDGQLYADLHGAGPDPRDPAEVLGGFLRALGVQPAAVPESREERSALYRAELADRRVLVVLDNAASVAQIRPLLPGTPTGAVLVTSRTQLVGLEGTRGFVLGLLTPAEAVRLLASIAGRRRVQAVPSEAARLAALCGHLPLALRIAGARLAAKPHWSLADLAGRLADERRRLGELHAGDLDVRASLDVSYQGRDEAERRAFRLLALTGNSDFPVWAAAALLDRTTARAADLMERLVDANLLTVTGRDSLGQLRYQFHDLLGLFARERLLEEEPAPSRLAAFQRLLTTLGGLARLAGWHLDRGQPPPAPVQPTAWMAPAAGPAAARPVDWFDVERAQLAAAIIGAAREGHTSAAAGLVTALAGYLEVRQDLQEWERLNEVALEAARRGGDHPAQAALLHTLGGLRCQQGLLEQALDCHADCLALARTIGDRRVEAATLRMAAMVHRLQGRLDDAAGAIDQSRRLLADLGDRHGDSVALLDLAEVHRLRDRPDEAAEALEQAVGVFLQLEDQIWAARALVGLGNARRGQGRPREAVRCLRDAMAAFRWAGDRRGEAHAIRGIAECLRDQGDFDGAVGRFQESLGIFSELGDDAGAARVQCGLGEAFREAGQPAAAIASLQRCLPVFERLGYPHWRGRALRGLGLALRDRGERAAAVSAWREALEAFGALDVPEAVQLQALLAEDRDAPRASRGRDPRRRP
jgi:DNA-binding SARP family transcriptional activator